MKVEFKIGAPSLTGKGAHEGMEAAVAGMEFPCSLQVVNYMPRAAVFPESGVELASAFASSGQSAEVKFVSAAALKRLLRSATQVAELNGYVLAMTVFCDDGDGDGEQGQTAASQTTEPVDPAEPVQAEGEAADAGDEAAGEREAADTSEEGDDAEGEESEGDADSTTNTDSDGSDEAGESSDAAGDTSVPAPGSAQPTRRRRKSKNK